jgi:hypothetical protein
LKSECNHIRQLLSEYIDGMLDASEMAAVQGHLHECADCSREYEALSSLVRKLGDIRAIKVPDDFLAKVHQKIEKPSFLGRVRDLFDFSRFRIPVEAAAFALTAVLILSLFYILPNEEKTKITQPVAVKAPSITGNKPQTAQPSQGAYSVSQSTETPPPAAITVPKQVVVKMAMSLNITQTTNPVPSQSVSYGDSGIDIDSLQDIWSDENYSTRKVLPIEINSKIDEVIKSAGGVLVSRENKAETGYPARLSVEIPGGNYRKFISQIGAIGVMKTRAPALQEVQDKVLIQLEFTSD